MRGEGPFWEQQGIDPGWEIGPGVGEVEIGAWEQRYGVPFPAVLKQPYAEQSGGYVRGSGIELALLRLQEIEPAEDELREYVSEPEINIKRAFYLGGDAQATLLLYFPDDGRGPEVYRFWSDGGALEKATDSVEQLLAE